MNNLQDKWLAAEMRPAGFDMLRILLALAVILCHAPAVCYPGIDALFWSGPWRPLVCSVVPAFFALSGFLVAGSLERNDLLSFVSLRVIRLFPALSAEVLISALIIGPWVTTLSLPAYLSNPEFHHYFLNMLGDIHYTLPGVFEGQPGGNYVNVQLWTVPYELKCYLLLTLAAAVGLAKRPRILMILTVVGLLALTLVRDLHVDTLPRIAAHPPGALLVASFMFGILLYLLRARILYSRWLFLASLVSFAVLVDFAQTMYLASLPIAYATVYIGLTNVRLKVFTMTADYSYGLYLYGFPVQQFLIWLLPDLRIWYVNFLLSTLIAGLFAMASWHFLELRVMQRRKVILGFIQGVRASLVAGITGLWKSLSHIPLGIGRMKIPDGLSRPKDNIKP